MFYRILPRPGFGSLNNAHALTTLYTVICALYVVMIKLEVANRVALQTSNKRERERKRGFESSNDPAVRIRWIAR